MDWLWVWKESWGLPTENHFGAGARADGAGGGGKHIWES